MSIPNSKQEIQINANTINTDDLDHLHDSFQHQVHEDDDDEEELMRVVLGRKPSGLSSSSAAAAAAACSNGKTFTMRNDIEHEKQSSSSSAGIEKALRKVFSMRASSASGNEVYRRLDHQYESVPVADEETQTMRSTHNRNQIKGGNKIIEACRRFFGF